MDKSKLFIFYRREMTEILSECTHSNELYFEDFENKISGLWAAAYREGLEERDFYQLLSEVIPEHKVEFNYLFKKAS
jgi:hypothetical protein